MLQRRNQHALMLINHTTPMSIPMCITPTTPSILDTRKSFQSFVVSKYKGKRPRSSYKPNYKSCAQTPYTNLEVSMEPPRVKRPLSSQISEQIRFIQNKRQRTISTPDPTQQRESVNKLSNPKWKAQPIIKPVQEKVFQIVKVLPKTYDEFLSQKEEQVKQSEIEEFYKQQARNVRQFSRKKGQNMSGFHNLLFRGLLDLTYQMEETGAKNIDQYLHEIMQENPNTEQPVNDQSIVPSESPESTVIQTRKKEKKAIQESQRSISLSLKSASEQVEVTKTIQPKPKDVMNQQDLDNKEPKKLTDGKWDQMYEVYEQLEKLKVKIQESLNEQLQYLQGIDTIRDDWIIKDSVINLHEGQLTMMEIEGIEYEFLKESHDRNYFEIDKIVVKNKFFQRFNKGVRVGILEQCRFRRSRRDQVLLNLFQEKNCLFIVLRGSCSLMVQYRTSDGQEHWQNMISFYEGQHFSESTLVQPYQEQPILDKTDILIMKLRSHPKFKKMENQVQTAQIITSRIVASEDIYLLQMKNDLFQQILIQSVEKDIEPKLKILQQINFFRDCLPISLIPLAASVSTERLLFGDYLIKKNDLVDRIFIISHGEFQVVLDNRLCRELKNSFFQTKKPVMRYKDIRDKSTRKYRQSDIQHQTDHHFFCKPPIAEGKSYDKGSKVKINDSMMEVTHHFNIKQLALGEVICCRAIYNSDDYIQKQHQFKSFNTSFQYAKLSIVVRSTEAEVFSLDYKQYASLPETLQNQIKQSSINEKEYDDCSFEELEKVDLEWQQLKQAYYKSFAIKKNMKTKHKI